MVFDYLLPWTEPADFFRRALTAERFTVDMAESILVEATLSDGRTVRLVTGVEDNHSYASIHQDQWYAFESPTSGCRSPSS